MDQDDLLQNLRLVVREEMTLFIERVDARFDHVDTLIHDLNARFERHELELQAVNAVFARFSPDSASSSS